MTTAHVLPRTASQCGTLLTNFLREELDMEQEADFRLINRPTVVSNHEMVITRTLVVRRPLWSSLNMTTRKLRNRLKKMMGSQLVEFEPVDTRTKFYRGHVVAYKISWLRT